MKASSRRIDQAFADQSRDSSVVITRPNENGGAPGGTISSGSATFEPAINGSKGRYAKPGYTTGASELSKEGLIYLLFGSFEPAFV